MTPLDCLDLSEDAEYYNVEFAGRDLGFRSTASRAVGATIRAHDLGVADVAT